MTIWGSDDFPENKSELRRPHQNHDLNHDPCAPLFASQHRQGFEAFPFRFNCIHTMTSCGPHHLGPPLRIIARAKARMHYCFSQINKTMVCCNSVDLSEVFLEIIIGSSMATPSCWPPTLKPLQIAMGEWFEGSVPHYYLVFSIVWSGYARDRW